MTKPGGGRPDIYVEGSYVYEVVVDGVVRYVGKGSKTDRMRSHLLARYSPKCHFHRLLALAWYENKEIYARLLVDGLSEEAAYAAERNRIASMPDGQLWNVKPGGGVKRKGFDRRVRLKDRWIDARRTVDVGETGLVGCGLS